MKKPIILLILGLYPLISFAQASGGQIRRPNSTVRNNRTLSTRVTSSKENLTNVVVSDDGKKFIYETSQAVDLGLPSGTIWAGWNIGANSPLEVGSYYAWGETEEKGLYDWNTYFDIESMQKNSIEEYISLSFKKYHVNGILSIIGTEHDAARMKWGEPWIMPTKAQLEELIRECEVHGVITPKGGNSFVVVVGPNGKSMLFPMAGEKCKKDLTQGWGVICWSGELCGDSPNSCFPFHLDKGISGIVLHNNIVRCYGLNVRAVMKKVL